MKLIDVTNSYPELVSQQLNNTDASFVKVYTLGKTTVIYTEAPTHKDIVLTNKQRNVKKDELDLVLERLLKETDNRELLQTIDVGKTIEVSLPLH